MLLFLLLLLLAPPLHLRPLLGTAKMLLARQMMKKKVPSRLSCMLPCVSLCQLLLVLCFTLIVHVLHSCLCFASSFIDLFPVLCLSVKNKTFKPKKKIEKGTNLHKLHKTVQASMKVRRAEARERVKLMMAFHGFFSFSFTLGFASFDCCCSCFWSGNAWFGRHEGGRQAAEGENLEEWIAVNSMMRIRMKIVMRR